MNQVLARSLLLLLGVATLATATRELFAVQDIALTSAIAISQHQATIGGRLLHYTARAGTIPIRDNATGEIHAHLFFVAYSLPRRPESRARPITFLWNGGPGSNSGLVHLLGFGPRRIVESAGPNRSPAAGRFQLVDNPESWLAATDLVFVDPVGTGYSRPTRPEYGPEFYQSPGDAESVAEFIRVCRIRLEAEAAPIFLLGESYGVTRASLVSEALVQRGIQVAGAILVSGGLPVGSKLSKPLQTALNLPIWTAAAHYHQRLAPELQQLPIDDAIDQSRDYAATTFAEALARGESLSPQERNAVVTQIARFSGVPAVKIDATKLAIPIEQFSTQVLGGDQRVGLYDSRAVGPLDKSGGPYDPTSDPSLKSILDGATVLRYLRNELGYRSELNYQGPFGGGFPPPESPRGDWMSVRWTRWKGIAVDSDDQVSADATKPQQTPPLEGLDAVMAADPRFRVFVASGYFDLVVNPFVIEQMVQRLPKDLAARVTSRVYAGGHAVYTDEQVRRQLQTDAFKFMQESVSSD